MSSVVWVRNKQHQARCQHCGNVQVFRNTDGNPLGDLDKIALCCGSPEYYTLGGDYDTWGEKHIGEDGLCGHCRNQENGIP